jgi:hypothetical protein
VVNPASGCCFVEVSLTEPVEASEVGRISPFGRLRVRETLLAELVEANEENGNSPFDRLRARETVG